jgi:plastocyanin
MKHRPWLAAVVMGGMLIPAGAAQAATKSVYAGTPPAGTLKGVPPVAFDNAFYPAKITIAAGDSLAVNIRGFHNAIYVPKGMQPPTFVVPSTNPPASGTDAAGAAFWWSGQPNFAPNPAVFAPSGKGVAGSKVANSGVGVSKPWKLKFPKKGTYALLCSIHPGMKLKVTVKKHGARVPSRHAVKLRIAKQAKAAAKEAKKLLAFTGPSGNVVRAGNDSRSIAAFAFFPKQKTVKVGTTVTFSMSRSSTEIHNVAFGPKDYLDGLVKRFEGPVLDPFTLYRSDAPGTTLALNGANHGNGFVNTGVLDTDRATPFAKSENVRFDKAGTYTYYCVIHGPEMQGTITVTP